MPTALAPRGSRWAQASTSTCRSSTAIREASRAPPRRSSARAGSTRRRDPRVIADVRSADVRVGQAQQALDAWRVDIVPSLEIEQRQAESAYEAGEVALFNVLDVSRRLVDGRMRQLDAEADSVQGAHRARTRDRPRLPGALMPGSCMRLSARRPRVGRSADRPPAHPIAPLRRRPRPPRTSKRRDPKPS